MIATLALAFWTISLASSVAESSTLSEQDLAKLLLELPAVIENAERPTSERLVDAAGTCEVLLSKDDVFSSSSAGWLVHHHGTDASVITREGVLIMHRQQEQNFPESCGIVAIPLQPYDVIGQTFAKKYNVAVTLGNAGNTLSTYPTTEFSTTSHTYQMKSAQNPKSALVIIIRNKE